jgi:hypothetical protein
VPIVLDENARRTSAHGVGRLCRRVERGRRSQNDQQQEHGDEEHEPKT